VSPRTLPRRRSRSSVAPAVGEIKRLREQLAAVTAHRDQLAGMLASLVDVIDHDSEIRYRAAIARTLAAVAAEIGEARGFERCAADYERAWYAAVHPIARGGPAYEDLELLRWGPAGRDHFGEPRPGDFPGTGVTR
jgi:hypothetical protein